MNQFAFYNRYNLICHVDLYNLIVILGLVLSNVKRLDVWELIAFNTVTFPPVKSQATAHGICRSHFTDSGSNGTARVIVVTTVCSLEKKRDRNLVINL